MNEFEIKYNKVFPVCILIASIFIISVGMLFATLSVISGLLLLILSIMMLIKPIMIFSTDTIFIKNMLGMDIKKLSYTKAQISFNKKSIYYNGKKILSGLLSAYDQAALKTFIDKNQ
jgi:hypothetical protein